MVLSQNQAERYADWQCGYCGEWKPVPELARCCEAKHEEAPHSQE